MRAILLVSVLVLGAAMPVFAAEEPIAVPAAAAEGKVGKGGHMKMDADGDKAISHDEFMQMAEKRFQKIDTNHDGKITREEHKAAAAMRGGKEGHAFP